MEPIWILSGVHQDPWGSVTYRQMLHNYMQDALVKHLVLVNVSHELRHLSQVQSLLGPEYA